MKKKFRLLNYLILIIIVIQFARLLYRNFQHLKPLVQMSFRTINYGSFNLKNNLLRTGFQIYLIQQIKIQTTRHRKRQSEIAAQLALIDISSRKILQSMEAGTLTNSLKATKRILRSGKKGKLYISDMERFQKAVIALLQTIEL